MAEKRRRRVELDPFDFARLPSVIVLRCVLPIHPFTAMDLLCTSKNTNRRHRRAVWDYIQTLGAVSPLCGVRWRKDPLRFIYLDRRYMMLALSETVPTMRLIGVNDKRISFRPFVRNSKTKLEAHDYYKRITRLGVLHMFVEHMNAIEQMQYICRVRLCDRQQHGTEDVFHIDARLDHIITEEDKAWRSRRTAMSGQPLLPDDYQIGVELLALNLSYCNVLGKIYGVVLDRRLIAQWTGMSDMDTNIDTLIARLSPIQVLLMFGVDVRMAFVTRHFNKDARKFVGVPGC